VTPPVRTSALPGREAELGRVLAVLDRRAPAVVSIRGARGSGKSAVTTAVVAEAARRGWCVTPYVDGRGVRVSGWTSETALCQDLAGALELPAVPPPDTLRGLVPLLLGRAAETPVLVVLDPYAPSTRLASLLRRHVLGRVRGSGLPVVLLVVTRGRLQGLPADLELEVLPPREDGVACALQAAAQGVVPPLGDDELAAYVAAARGRPRLLASLTALLPLSRPGAGHELPSPRPPAGLS